MAQYRYFHEGQLKVDPTTGTRCRTGQLNHQFVEQKFIAGAWVGIGDNDGVRYGDVAAAGCRFREGMRDGDYEVDVETEVGGFLLAEGDGWVNCGGANGYWTNPSKLLGGELPNLWVKKDTRNGLVLPDTINPGAGDVSILPACSGSTGDYVDLGTSYNPTATCFTVYTKIKWTGGASTNTILSSVDTTDNGLSFMIRSTGEVTTYQDHAYRNSALVVTAGVWTELMFRYTTGVGGKIEIAKDGGAFETVYSASFQTSLIIGDGKLLLANYWNHNLSFLGAISVIKLWTSSKGWANINNTAEKKWVFNGSPYITDIDAVNPLNGFFSEGLTHISAIYDSNGSSQSLDYGYSLWQKYLSLDIQVPHNTDGTPISITAGVEIPAGYTLTKEVAGDILNHNLADSKIRFIGADWDRSDVVVFSSTARETTFPVFYDSVNPKDWHISEVNKSVMLLYYNELYRAKTFPKFTTNSFTTRGVLKELFAFDTLKTGSDLTSLLRYTGDTGVYALETKFIDLHYCATRGDKILAFNDVDTMSLSLDGGVTFGITLDVTGVIAIVTFAHIFENGNIIFANHTKMYLSTDNLAHYAETTVLNQLGAAYVPDTYDNFKSIGYDYANIGGLEILCFGNYTTTLGNKINAWYSVDSGVTIKSSKLMVAQVRHIHGINFNSTDNSFWMQTGDILASQWWKGTYNIALDTWSWNIVAGVDSVPANIYVKTLGIRFYGGNAVWASDARYYTGEGGIYKCEYSDILDPTKYERVYITNTDITGICSIGRNMIAMEQGISATDKIILTSINGGVSWIKHNLYRGVNLDDVAQPFSYFGIANANNDGYYLIQIKEVGETLTNYTKGQVLMARIIEIS